MRKLEKIQPFGHSKASKIKKLPHIAHFSRPRESDPYAHHPHEPHGSATAWPTLTSTLSTYTYPTPNLSTSNLNHLHLSIYLPHTHMQVSGIWILEGTSSYRAPIHPHLVLQIGVGGVAVDVLGRTEMLQTKFPVHEGFQLKMASVRQRRAN